MRTSRPSRARWKWLGEQRERAAADYDDLDYSDRIDAALAADAAGEPAASPRLQHIAEARHQLRHGVNYVGDAPLFAGLLQQKLTVICPTCHHGEVRWPGPRIVIEERIKERERVIQSIEAKIVARIANVRALLDEPVFTS